MASAHTVWRARSQLRELHVDRSRVKIGTWASHTAGGSGSSGSNLTWMMHHSSVGEGRR